jgi:hypothetical protein
MCAGLFRARARRQTSGLRTAARQPGSPLRERLAGAFGEILLLDRRPFVETPRATAKAQNAASAIALTMIPPVTGNGMSMAFESAEMRLSR